MMMPTVPMLMPFSNRSSRASRFSPDFAYLPADERAHFSSGALDRSRIVDNARAMPAQTTWWSHPRVYDGNFSSRLVDNMHAKNASIGCDTRLRSDFEHPKRSKHLGKPVEDKVLCPLAAHPFERWQPTPAIQKTWCVDQDHPSYKISGPRVDGGMPTEFDAYMSDTIAPFPVSKHEGGSPHLDHSSRSVIELMVCNLPCKLSEEGLAQMVDELGFGGLYFRTYVPRGRKNNMGYGFVCFFDPWAAENFAAAVRTYGFAGSPKQPYCKVAVNQGSRPLYL